MDQRVARRPENLLVAKRGQRRDQSGQHPEGDEQGNDNVSDQIHLDPGDLLEVDRPGGVGGNGKNTVGRQAHDEFRHAG